jgi:hypothetical protein
MTVLLMIGSEDAGPGIDGRAKGYHSSSAFYGSE